MRFLQIIFVSLVFPLCIVAQVVSTNGQLKVNNTQLMNEAEQPVVLRGMSYGWHNWWPRFFNKESVAWLVDDWHVSVVRAAMGVEPEGAYISNSDFALEKMEAVINAAIENDIYVLVDWHSHGLKEKEAIAFFTYIAKKYGDHPNIIYEIFNEPIHQSWRKVKKYSVNVIKAIRKYDTNNVILVGSPHWDQDLHIVADNPIEGVSNIMYTMHFYAGTHTKKLRDNCDYALSKGIPIFVSECAGMNADGDGTIDIASWNTFLNWMEQHKISWVCWSIADKNESCSVLIPEAASTGNWEENDVKEWGQICRKTIRELNNQE